MRRRHRAAGRSAGRKYDSGSDSDGAAHRIYRAARRGDRPARSGERKTMRAGDHYDAGRTSLTHSVIAVTWPFLGGMTLMLLISLGSINALSAMRAYVAGVAVWI